MCRRSVDVVLATQKHVFFILAESISQYLHAWGSPRFQWVPESSFYWDGIPRGEWYRPVGVTLLCLGWWTGEPVPKLLYLKPEKALSQEVGFLPLNTKISKSSAVVEAFSLCWGLKPPKIRLQSWARIENFWGVILKSGRIISLGDAIHHCTSSHQSLSINISEMCFPPTQIAQKVEKELHSCVSVVYFASHQFSVIMLYLWM